MKNFIKYLLILTINFYTKSSTGQVTKATATGAFGRYGQCTSGRGICGIEADNLNAKSTTAEFNIEKENDSTLILKIQKTKISVADEVVLFGKHLYEFSKDEAKYFKMDIALPLAQATKLALQVANKYNNIPMGTYLVNSFDSYFLIELKLR